VLAALVRAAKTGSLSESSGGKKGETLLHDVEQDIYQNPYYLDSIALTLVYRRMKLPAVQKLVAPLFGNI
jgi:hypothetical protein